MPQTDHASTARKAFAIGLNLLPITLFYGLLVRQSFNLPLLPDDYHALLHPVTDLRTIASIPHKLAYWVAAQHAEYKLWFEVAVTWLQSSLSGQVNFRFLSLLGDACLLPIALMLWFLSPQANRPWYVRLIWFAPVTILLFELTFWETLNWPMGGLQVLPVVVFSMLGVHSLLRPGLSPFLLACCCLALAVGSSGNGLLLVPLGCLALLRSGSSRRIVGWLALSVFLIVGYSYHYDTFSSQHRSVFATLLHLSPTYTFAFLGSVIGLHGCVTLGLLLSALNGWLLYSGYFKRHRAIGYYTLFIFVTAVGVAGIRSELGIGQAASSRYRIYSALLVCFAWLYLVDKALTWPPFARKRMLAATLLVVWTFALLQDRHGYAYLRARKQYAVEGMEHYVTSKKTGTQQGPVAWTTGQPDYYVQNNAISREYLQKAERVGTFRVH